MEALGAQVASVGFAPAELLRMQADDLELPFPLLRDPEHTTYRAFGLGKGSFWAVWGWRTMREYASLMLRGRRPRKIEADPYQLGGDFVIDGADIVRYAYVSRDPVDRPPVTELLDALREAAG